MDENEWLNCVYPKLMLDFVRGKISKRKRRLAVGSYPLKFARLLGGLGRWTALLLTRPETALCQAATLEGLWAADFERKTEELELSLVDPEAYEVARHQGKPSMWKATILRDLIGNPFRPLPPIDPSVFAWGGDTIRQLAEAIYNERSKSFGKLHVPASKVLDAYSDFSTMDLLFALSDESTKNALEAIYQERLRSAGILNSEQIAVLADALEEASGPAKMVDHLRSPGFHVFGYHVIDALLEKT
jgi:hypothetical protein